MHKNKEVCLFALCLNYWKIFLVERRKDRCRCYYRRNKETSWSSLVPSWSPPSGWGWRNWENFWQERERNRQWNFLCEIAFHYWTQSNRRVFQTGPSISGQGMNYDRWIYSRLPLTQTIAYANLALTRTKIDFPWISSIHVLNLPLVTLTLVGCSNLSLTRSNVCCPSDRFYKNLPSITWTMLESASQVLKKFTAVRNIDVISKNLYTLSLRLWQYSQFKIQFPAALWMIYQALKCACYMHCFPVSFPYFRLFASNSRKLELPLARTFFDFPRRFDCSCKKWPLIQATFTIDLTVHSLACPAVK